MKKISEMLKNTNKFLLKQEKELNSFLKNEFSITSLKNSIVWLSKEQEFWSNSTQEEIDSCSGTLLKKYADFKIIAGLTELSIQNKFTQKVICGQLLSLTKETI